MCEEFASLMNGKFKISMMWELSFFLKLMVKQSSEGTLIC